MTCTWYAAPTMDTIAVLKVLSATVATALGVIAVIAETRTTSGHLTRWARWVLAGVLTTGLIGVTVEVQQAFAERQRAAKADRETKEQLEAVRQTLQQVLRTTNMLPAKLNVAVSIRVPLDSFESAAAEVRMLAEKSGRWPDSTLHIILLEDTSSVVRDQLVGFDGPVIVDVMQGAGENRDLSLKAEFTAAGLQYDDATNEIVVWSRATPSESIRNTGVVTSFLDFPGKRIRVRMINSFCPVENCRVDALRLVAEDGREFEVENFARTADTHSEVIAPVASAPRG